MQVNLKVRTMIMAAALCACSSMAMADADPSRGAIVWTGGYVSGIGVGTAKASGNKTIDKIHALRAAEVIAQRSLLETIKGVKIDSSTTVENMVLVEDKIKSRVQGMVKGAEIYQSKVEWEDGVPVATVEMRICLAGEMNGCKGPGLASALNLERMRVPSYAPAESLPLQLPPAITQQPAPEAQQPAPQPAPAATQPAPAVTQAAPADGPPDAKSGAVKYDSSRKVTGLVLNLDGQFFEREMLPIIATRSGGRLNTVYCVKNVKPSVVRTWGAVRYADSLDQAAKIPELGDNLLIIPVTEVTKENMVVITVEHANLVRQTIMNGNDYLNEAKVAISSH